MAKLGLRIFLALCAVVVGTAVPGCLPAAQNSGPGGGGSGDKPMDTPEDVFGIQCTAHFTLQGTFAIGEAQPSDVFGCWPVGDWKFSATVAENSCPQAPPLKPEYSFRVTRIDGLDNYTYLTDPTYEFVRIKVTSGGGGLCEGGVLVYSTDGKIVTNFKPTLNADMTLGGQGDYDVHAEDQRP